MRGIVREYSEDIKVSGREGPEVEEKVFPHNAKLSSDLQTAILLVRV